MIFIIIIYHRTSANFILVPLVIINDSRKDKSYRFSFLFIYNSLDRFNETEGYFLTLCFFHWTTDPCLYQAGKK